MKGNKGITLIALVVTIIVLLILAGVAIAMLTGDNSILKRSQSTKAYNSIGAAKDEIATAYNAAYAEFMRKLYDDAITDKSTLSVAAEFTKELGNNKIIVASGTTATGAHGTTVTTDIPATPAENTTYHVLVKIQVDGKWYSVKGDFLNKGTSSSFEWEAMVDGLTENVTTEPNLS